MAIFHLTAKTGSRGGGQSAKAKADYHQRQGQYARGREGDRDDLVFAHSGNMPAFADSDPSAYWEAADQFERANGRLYKELEFSLPRELSLDQQKTLAAAFAERITRDESLPFTLVIHRDKKGRNPHCHLMLSERSNDGIERPAKQWFKRWNGSNPEKGGARKTEALKPKEWLEQTRASWADFANRALEANGHSDRIDHRTLAAQGIEREPGRHIGPVVSGKSRRGRCSLVPPPKVRALMDDDLAVLSELPPTAPDADQSGMV